MLSVVTVCSRSRSKYIGNKTFGSLFLHGCWPVKSEAIRNVSIMIHSLRLCVFTDVPFSAIFSAYSTKYSEINEINCIKSA